MFALSIFNADAFEDVDEEFVSPAWAGLYFSCFLTLRCGRDLCHGHPHPVLVMTAWGEGEC